MKKLLFLLMFPVFLLVSCQSNLIEGGGLDKFKVESKDGKIVSISLNGEELELINDKVYFPAKELTESEKSVIDFKVFSKGKEYSIKNGQVFQNKKIVSDFEGEFNLRNGISIYIKGDYWESTKKELNSNQYSELYQTSSLVNQIK